MTAGGDLYVEWDFQDNGHLLHEMDAFLLYSYGRPETAQQTDRPHNTVTVPGFTGRLQIQAPFEPGVYEIGYFSHRLQAFLCHGPAVHVHPLGTVLDVPRSCSIDEGLTFTWTAPVEGQDPEDRYRIYTDDMSLFASGPVHTGPGRRLGAGSGSVWVRINRPGTFILTYWSARLDDDVAQSKPFDVLGDWEMTDLDVRFKCASSVPFDRLFEVEFEVTGEDLRTSAEQMSDTVCLYHHEDRDYVETTRFDDAARCQALQTLPLRGERSGTLRFAAPSIPGRYDLRYMVDTAPLFQATVVRCTFDVVDDPLLQGPPGPAGVFQFHSAPALEAAPHERTVLEDVTIRQGGRPSSALSTASSRAGKVTDNPDLQSFFNMDTEYAGSIVTPKAVTVNSSIAITYHLTMGGARPADMIVLLDDAGRDRIYASAELVDAVGRADLSLGTVILRVPEKVGLYIAAYFSTKYRSLVLASPPFKAMSHADNARGGVRTKAGLKLILPVGTSTREAEEAQALMGAAPPLLLSTEPPPPPSDVKVLLCGVLYKGEPHEVRGAVNDVSLLAQVLVHTHNLSPHHVVVLSEDAPPARHPISSNIRKGFRWLTQDLEAGSKRMVFYSGSGSLVNTMQGPPEQGMDACIVPPDNDWAMRCITYTEIWDTLYEPLPPGARMTCFMDCGHTPNVRDAAAQRGWTYDDAPRADRFMAGLLADREADGMDPDFRGRCVLPPAFMFPTHDNSRRLAPSTFKDLIHPHSGAVARQDQRDPPPGAVMNLVRSCRPGQTCHDTFLDGRYHGVFTWAMLKVLREFQSVTIDEFMGLTMQYIQSAHYVQHPQLFVSSMENLHLPLL